MTFIALLRGINVGGQKSIKMTDLVHLFESLGMENVRTYVQSGNVLFEHASATSAQIARRIEKKIEQTYGSDVSVIIRTPVELKKVISRNPFLKKSGVQTDRLYVTFLSEVPNARSVAALDIPKDPQEKFTIAGKEVYLYCPNGYGNSKLNNTTFEKKLNVVATTRNWKTTTMLLELSQEQE